MILCSLRLVFLFRVLTVLSEVLRDIQIHHMNCYLPIISGGSKVFFPISVVILPHIIKELMYTLVLFFLEANKRKKLFL